MFIQVLTPGFETPNGRAFLFPLITWQKQLAQYGFRITFESDFRSLIDSDVILVDSKYHREFWSREVERVFFDFEQMRQKASTIIYCDTTDSTGGLQTELLSRVDRYWKAQLLKNRHQYMFPLYGNRPYSDFYHREIGVEDVSPEWSLPIENADYLQKLDVSWCSGLADYSLYGPLRMALFQRLSSKAFVKFRPKSFIKPNVTRANDLACRFGASYSRASVAWQRTEIRRRLGSYIETRKLSRRQYFSEMANSKVVVSPFGFGEITLKDFEVFITGGLLVKPDMSHMETWPHLFSDKKTIITHSWDLGDIESIIEAAVSDYSSYVDIAQEGQNRYWTHTVGPNAAELFCQHFKSLLDKR